MRRTREMQFWIEMQEKWGDWEYMSRRLDMLNWQWEDYDDFIKKYGRDTNFEARVTQCQVWMYYDLWGLYVRNKVMDINQLDPMLVYNVLLFWRRFSPVILEMRKRSRNVLWKNYLWHNFEWLAKECEKREQQIILELEAKAST